jgi:hypothetical protein
LKKQGGIALKRKTESWDYALGIIQVDGLTPSDEFLELVEKEKAGEMTTEDMKRVLDKKYKAKDRVSIAKAEMNIEHKLDSNINF